MGGKTERGEARETERCEGRQRDSIGAFLERPYHNMTNFGNSVEARCFYISRCAMSHMLEEMQKHRASTLIPRLEARFPNLAVTSQLTRKSTKKFGSHEQNDENRLDLCRPVVLLYGQPYFTLPLDNIDRYYIWRFGIHIVDFGVYLHVLARQPDCRLNNTVKRVFKPSVIATRMTVVLLYEPPNLILPSSNIDSYLIWRCGIYFVDSAVVFVHARAARTVHFSLFSSN
jgi:hypothetical protein